MLRGYIFISQEVVASLDRNNVMMILDNQISKPGWCCSDFDGNGFFGDQYFDPDVWLKGLTIVATMFNNSTNVVGMSLRNELRGPRQNVSVWYRYHTHTFKNLHFPTWVQSCLMNLFLT